MGFQKASRKQPAATMPHVQRVHAMNENLGFDHQLSAERDPEPPS